MSGIKHEWNGTVLTITSDSGTSSADLKGEKGDTGIRGAQGAAGIIVDTTGKLIITEYATMKYVDEAVNNIDLTGYATEEFVVKTITDGKVDLSEYATKEYVDDAVSFMDVDLTGYATKYYVDSAIAAISEPVETAALDFTDFYNGSFTETLEDGSKLIHIVAFNSDGNITSIGGIAITGVNV